MACTEVSTNKKPTLYCAWWCPFARRAWIALLTKGVDFVYKETNPYNKTDEFLAVNPRGLVPTIDNGGACVYESTVCIEYIDEAWETDEHLLPKHPYEKAKVRMWSDFINKKLVPFYYTMLIKQEKELQEQAKRDLLTNLEIFVKGMSTDGPFFLGEKYGMVDIMFTPWADYLYVLKHYRGFDVVGDEKFVRRFNEWWAAVKEVPSVKRTKQDTQRVLEKYSKYANDTYESQVATAIRKGTGLP